MKKTIIVIIIAIILAILYRVQIANLVQHTIRTFQDEKSTKTDWERWEKKNPETYAWITVPGTPIDYPVVQHATDDAYYLTHDIEGEENIYGAIFTESINKEKFTDPLTVVYGHNMRDGSMFGSLKNFSEDSFFEENHQITISLKTGEVLTYEIVAAYKYPADHILSAFDFSTDDKVADYLEKVPTFVKEYGGNYRENPSLKAPVITLSTCTSSQDDYRYLVQGVLVEKKSEE